MDMLICLLMNSIVALSASFLCRSLVSGQDIIDYCLSWFVLYFMQIVFSLEFLGIFSLLSLRNVIVLNLIILGIVLFLTKNKRISKDVCLTSRIQTLLSRLKFKKNHILCLAAILGFVIVKIFVNLVNPPFGWDNLNYHFTFPVEWLKHGNLDNPISISGDFSVSYYPINGNLFFLWFILPLKNVFLADLGQVPFFIAAFFAVFAISRKIGLGREYALFSATLFSLIPNYFKQLRIAYVDIIVASLFLITLNFIIQASKERSLSRLFLASLSLGLMLGAKTTAMPLALFLMLLLLVIILFNFRDRIVSVAAVAIVGIIMFGGYSFIKNIILTGNPLYPLNFQLFNLTLFQGVVDNSVYRTAIRPGDFSLAKLLFSEGLGAQTLLLVLPAILAGPVIFFIKRKSINFILAYLLVLPVLLVLVFRFVLPLPNIRYVYALFAVGMIIAFYLLTLFKVPKILTYSLVFVCVLVSIAENAKRLELVFSLVLTVLFFILLPFLLKYVGKKPLKIWIFLTVVLLFPTLILFEKDYTKHEFSRYVTTTKLSGYWPDAARAWEWLNNNTDGNNIAYIGRPVGFPLYGTNFKNNVYYVSVNKVEPAMLHYFPDSKYIWGFNGNQVFRNFESPQNYRGNADYNVWLGNLKNKKIDFLFIYSELIKKTDDFPIEDKWAMAHPEIFDLVFKNNAIHIYRIHIK